MSDGDFLLYRRIEPSVCHLQVIIADQERRASSHFVVQSATGMDSGSGQTVPEHDA
jgi:hypothetical protein